MEPFTPLPIILEALEHHFLFWPEFFLRKQRESPWSQDLFLKGLRAELASYSLRLRLQKAAKKGSLSLNSLTKGRVKEYSLPSGTTTGDLDKDLIEELLNALTIAQNKNITPQVYTPLQIVAIANHSMNYILDEFKVQAGLQKSVPFMRTSPKGFGGKTAQGKKANVLHRYKLRTPTPFLDYPPFEEAVRNLVLNSRHPENLKPILEPFFEKGKEAVKLWNEHIQKLEVINDDSVVRSEQCISYEPKTAKITAYSNIATFMKSEYRTFSNYDLTVYASNAGSLVVSEVPGLIGIEKEDEPIKPKPEGIPSKLFLLFLYREDGKFKQNEHINLAIRALGLSYGTLRNDYLKVKYYINNDERLKDGEMTTFETYNARLNDPEFYNRLRQLKKG